MSMGRFFHKKSSKNCPPGGVTILGCGAKALMDGVIVAVVHDEFRGMGVSGVGMFLGDGVVVVVDVRGMIDEGVVKRMGVQCRGL